MNVSSVKNLNGETFSAVQDATLTDVVQTNSGNWNEISAYELASADYITAHQSLEDYATTADVDTVSSFLSGAIDYVSSNAGGGGGAGDYVPLSANKVLIGSANVTNNYSYNVLVQGKCNSGIGYDVFAQGFNCYATTVSIAQGQGSSALTGSIAQGIDSNGLSGNYAENYSMAQGNSNSAIGNSLSRGIRCYASGNSIANGNRVIAKDCSFALGSAHNVGFPSAAKCSINIGAGSANNGSIHLGLIGITTQGSIATNTSATNFSLALSDDVYLNCVSADNGSIATMNTNSRYNPVAAQNNSIGLGASALNGSLALCCGESYDDINYASAHSIAVGKGVSATNYGLALGKYNKVTSAAIVVGNGEGSDWQSKDTFIVFHDGNVSAMGDIKASGMSLQTLWDLVAAHSASWS